MAVLTSMDERRRRSRNIVFGAFILLVVIWTVKLAYPKHTIISLYQSHRQPYAPIYSDLADTEEEDEPAKKESPWKSRPSSKEGSQGTGLPETAFNASVSNKAAVIVEARFRAALIPLILHYNSVLGPSWPILIYTTAESVGMFATSAALARYIKTGTIQVRLLPQSTLLQNSESVNRFMTDTWFWEDLAPVEHVLIFQSDSMLCANAARSVDDFFEYDMIGAPVSIDAGVGYKGGLSLRKRSTILRVLDDYDWEKTPKDGDKFEDQWFFNRMADIQAEEAVEGIEPKDEGAINLPTVEITRTFSVESIDYPHPLGVRRVHRWLDDQKASLEEWCPEYKLCSVDSIAEKE
ncbi:hypothetical protein WAI453_001172 [Rhynchosporium graminicola]|uniref:Related to MNN4 Regulates the mannosylphosphorylation n=1 Tax=Rhynchosporium graminicola TaxID=2792576 RepID=A0A1E1KAJ9_9HELO|nr:related to MNN4 Regulates the mannosylphosphorylation [Rhynchosporium commune]